MNCNDSNQHVHHDAEGRDAAEQADDQSQAAEEFGANRQKSQWSRDAHLLGEEAHGALEAVAAKPAQHLLRAVREKYDAQH